VCPQDCGSRAWRLGTSQAPRFFGAEFPAHCAGFREWLNDMGEAMESWEVKLTSLRDLGDGRVLASGTLHATSKAGVPIEVENWFISTVRDGKIVRSQVYESHAQALEAAGLSE
jgi:ketosteroid isomerase-like protein